MIAALAAALFLNAPTTFELMPTDDVWVYPHASDPARDPYLRIWGVPERAVAANVDEIDSFSYGYLRFDLSRLPKDQKLTAAELVMIHVATPGFSAEDLEKRPIQARLLSASFTEKGWNYELVNKVAPGKGDDSVLGIAKGTINAEDKPFALTINLLEGKADFRKNLESHSEFLVALTSTVSPEVGGMKAVYKVYSKDAENEANRPRLRLRFE